MAITKKTCIVQFPHPGLEHNVTKTQLKAGIKPWNNGPHRRKFIKANGEVIDINGNIRKDTLYFWGEWEPDSYVTKLSPTTKFEPRYLHQPVLLKNNAAGGNTGCGKNCVGVPNSVGTNTDPFVFGDYFLYSCCRQIRQGRPTQMAYLNVGSLIVFGSMFNDLSGKKLFAIDTIFVIADSKAYTGPTYQKDLKGFIPKNYGYIMGYNSWGNDPFVCYKGATPYNKVNNMYSFVPCKTGAGAAKGFERPVLNVAAFNKYVKGMFQSNLAMNVKLTQNVTDALAKSVWNDLRSQIHNQGFEEGIMIQY